MYGGSINIRIPYINRYLNDSQRKREKEKRTIFGQKEGYKKYTVYEVWFLTTE